MIQCKNKHKYHVSDIFPLRKSQFEGVHAWIPYRYNEILVEEYPKGLSSMSHYEYVPGYFDINIRSLTSGNLYANTGHFSVTIGTPRHNSGFRTRNTTTKLLRETPTLRDSARNSIKKRTRQSSQISRNSTRTKAISRTLRSEMKTT